MSIYAMSRIFFYFTEDIYFVFGLLMSKIFTNPNLPLPVMTISMGRNQCLNGPKIIKILGWCPVGSGIWLYFFFSW